MFKLASWNVNSLKVRLPQVLHWLSTVDVDVLALQETKVIDEDFPVNAFHELGYHLAFSGQKTYNGVALVSRWPIDETVTSVPEFVDPQKRILAGTVCGLRIINLYVPNGAMVGSDKYDYKLGWLEKVTDFIRQQLSIYPHLAVVGDFNIAPEDKDVHEPALWQDCVLVSACEREAFASLLELGLKDSLRLKTSEGGIYSWWDYRQGAFRRNHGMRIDHVLLSEALSSYCIASQIDVEPRRDERPSDHAPVYVTLDWNGNAGDVQKI